MPWNGGWQVKIFDQNELTIPKTSGAPSLAVSFGYIYLSYLGANGENIYFSRCNGNALDFTAWLDPLPIVTPSNKKLEAREPPVIAVFPEGQNLDTVVMAYPDHKTGNLVSLNYRPPVNFQDLGTWTDPVPVEAFPAEVSHQPVLCGAGLRLYLLALDKKGAPWYSFQSFGANRFTDGYSSTAFFPAKQLPRTEAQIKDQSQVKYWGLAQLEANLFLFGFAEEAFFLWSTQNLESPVDAGWEYLGPFPLPANNPVNPWVFPISSIGLQAVPLVFTLKGKHDLNTIDFTVNPPPVPPYTAIHAGNGRFLSNKMIAGILNTNADPSLYMAYKDSVSDDIYFAFFTP